MEKSSIWVTWGTANEGVFILVDLFCCHFNSDTVHTATTNGYRHPSDTVQILSLQPLMRCSWNQKSWSNLSGPCWMSGEKEILKDRTGLALSGEWAPSLYSYHALNWIFLLTLCRQKLLQIYNRVFAWLNKKYSEKGREIAPFSKWGQKQMDTFLLLDHIGLCLR